MFIHGSTLLIVNLFTTTRPFTKIVLFIYYSYIIHSFSDVYFYKC